VISGRIGPSPSSDPNDVEAKKPRLIPGNFYVVNGYIEQIALPTAGFGHGVLNTMGILVDHVEAILNDMKANGC
jgi:hypothetical protein